MPRILSKQKALARLNKLRSDFTHLIRGNFEHRAKDCLTCETRGACCLDAHFVNVHISRLEAATINDALDLLPQKHRLAVTGRIDDAISTYDLDAGGDTYALTFACPLFEKGTGCLVHESGKPLACIAHACYERAEDVPPGDLLTLQEERVDALSAQTYGRREPWLPLPVALRSARPGSGASSEDKGHDQSGQEPPCDLIDQLSANKL